MASSGMVRIYGFIPAYNFPNQQTILHFLAAHKDTRPIYEIDQGLIERVSDAFDGNKGIVPEAIEHGAWHAILNMKDREVILEKEFEMKTFDKVRSVIVDVLKECAKAYVRGELIETKDPLPPPFFTKEIKEEPPAPPSICSIFTSCCFTPPPPSNDKWYLSKTGRDDAVRWQALSDHYYNIQHPIATQPKAAQTKASNCFACCVPSKGSREESERLMDPS